MWKAFGVESPVWGYTIDRTTHELAGVQVMALDDFSEPRIEPEIMFGLRAAPGPTMSDSALVDCVEWIALGYEIVQSIFPDRKFSAADTVAANGVHGPLLIGTRHAVAPRKTEWQRELSTFEVELSCDSKLAQRGGGSLVSPKCELVSESASEHFQEEECYGQRQPLGCARLGGSRSVRPRARSTQAAR
jgi:2-oxo-3-hexenedioate decarboxylase